ncbi:hypothetical protein [Kangiella sp. HZ709]|uniref:hypothetical protein n=1 Tax=Kangiella sp. HZ709 TaxID=2666328 RepID=UPI0012B11D75|nr:hypothetical protein [Kangiella sp. HZ709]MRX26837.1 hypothetical protein [Kangiella sp. HZ709]
MKYTVEELLQLAIRAMNQSQDDHALNYLNQAHEQDSDNASVNYLLAAQFAEMGLYEKALASFETTLSKEPNMHYARFQCGLLQLTQNIIEPSRENFEYLTQQEDNPELALFGRGLIKLIEDDFENSKILLNEGKSINTLNPALNNDIDKILTQINIHLKGGDAESGKAADASKGQSSVFLSAYQNNDDD